MKVLLVKPWGDAFNWYHSHMLGLAYLAGYLREKGHEIHILDAAFHRMQADDLLGEVKRFQADVVGVTAMTHEALRANEVFQAVKSVHPEVKTLLGGPHATAAPALSIEQFPDLDFAVSGEGERPFEAVLENLDGGSDDFSAIEGLAYRNNGNVIYNGPQTDFLDIEHIPSPAVDLYYTKNWFKENPKSEYRLFASRGCPFRCAYCMRVLGGKVRWRNPDDVIEEWIKAVEYYGAREVFLHDEIFLYDNKTTHTILEGILKTDLPKKAIFHAMTHPKLVHPETLEMAKEANCFKVCIGVEAGNNQILKNSGRNYTIKEANEAVQAIKKAGLHPFTFFILGHPGETHKTVRDTIWAAVKLNPWQMGMGVMVPYPGTKIYELAKENKMGYRLLDASWDAYDRYGGRSLEIKGLSRRSLVFYQVLGYMAFFLLNGKFKGMYEYFKPKAKAALRVISGKGLSGGQ